MADKLLSVIIHTNFIKLSLLFPFQREILLNEVNFLKFTLKMSCLEKNILWTMDTVDRSLFNYRQLQGCTFKRLINIIVNTASSVFDY